MSDARWKVGQWHGMPNYECPECPFSTLREGEIRAHVDMHEFARRPIARESTILAPSGAPAIVEEPRKSATWPETAFEPLKKEN